MNRRELVRGSIAICLGLFLFIGNLLAQSVGQFRGTRAFTESIARRFYVGPTLFTVGPYLGVYEIPFVVDLTDLLGTYLPRSSESQFVNSNPNPVNVLLWEIIAQGIARDLNSLCLVPGPSTTLLANFGTLNPDLIAAVRANCRWAETSRRTEVSLRNLWNSIMRYDAPEGEYLAFRDFFMTAPQVDDASGSHVESMAYAIMMNPYFVLRR